MYRKRTHLQEQLKLRPKGAYYITNRKHMRVEAVLVKWLEDQRKRCNPVNKRMIKEAAKTTYTILADQKYPFDSDSDDTLPSFSASWFDGFKNRHNITYCQLRGEAVSVGKQRPWILKQLSLSSFRFANSALSIHRTTFTTVTRQGFTSRSWIRNLTLLSCQSQESKRIETAVLPFCFVSTHPAHHYSKPSIWMH